MSIYKTCMLDMNSALASLQQQLDSEHLLAIGLTRAKEVHFGHILSLQQPHLHHSLRCQNVLSFLHQHTQQSAAYVYLCISTH